MNEYYAKLGPGPYYYDNSAVAAALRYVADRLYTDWGELQHPHQSFTKLLMNWRMMNYDC